LQYRVAGTADAGGVLPDPLARQVQDVNRLDIAIYEEDYFTRALLQKWPSQAGYHVLDAVRGMIGAPD
jgi:hypothetical protein